MEGKGLMEINLHGRSLSLGTGADSGRLEGWAQGRKGMRSSMRICQEGVKSGRA